MSTLRVVESVTGTYYYHLASVGSTAAKGSGTPTRPLCDARGGVMPTSIPLSAWGVKSHLHEKWCQTCARLGGI